MTFKRVSLENLCQLITDGSHSSPTAVSSGIPMYSVKDMTDFGFSSDSAKQISEEDYEKLKRSGCQPQINDVLIAKDGSVLKHTFAFKNLEKCALLSSIAILRPDPNLINQDYLVHVLHDPQLRSEILSNYVSGSGVPRIVLKDFKKIQIHVPELSLQKAIASVLEDLNDKIHLNSLLISKLELLAQTIFKSWFINFDPVILKMSGEIPNVPNTSKASLFPDSMVGSELGLIPEGWAVSSLSQIATISKKSVNPQLHPNTTFSHFSIPAFDAGNYPAFVSGSNILSGKFSIDGPSVLVSKLNPHTQRIWTIAEPPQNAICSTEFIVLKAKAERDFFFVDQIVRERRFQYSFISMATRSTGSRQRVRPDEILELPIVVPDDEILEEFANVVSPIIKKIDFLRGQIQTLLKTRDSLLPKLISGELQIPQEMLPK